MMSEANLDDLDRRMREPTLVYNRGPNYEPLSVPPSPLQVKAADAIAALRAENERLRKERDEAQVGEYQLREALAPFVNVSAPPETADENSWVTVTVSAGQWRHAKVVSEQNT
jgi:hypothetical protein